MNFKKINEEVYLATTDIISLKLNDLDLLKQNISACPNHRIRMCAHQTKNDTLHEMLIALTKKSYVRPHKHLNKSESFHMIEGRLDVVLFDDAGNIVNVIEMSDPSSGKHFFYRLSTSCFHTLVLHTDLVVFHETTNGPFVIEDTLFAPWAPLAGNRLEEEKFMEALANKIEEFNQ
ncbi:MAG: hypothetical protein ACD_60C00028G0028 [uncultured bacterium]|nr:MAG: hypothetical protein ACD_60C00028G0028 [uncultured bacterium]